MKSFLNKVAYELYAAMTQGESLKTASPRDWEFYMRLAKHAIAGGYEPDDSGRDEPVKAPTGKTAEFFGIEEVATPTAPPIFVTAAMMDKAIERIRDVVLACHRRIDNLINEQAKTNLDIRSRLGAVSKKAPARDNAATQARSPWASVTQEEWTRVVRRITSIEQHLNGLGAQTAARIDTLEKQLRDEYHRDTKFTDSVTSNLGLAIKDLQQRLDRMEGWRKRISTRRLFADEPPAP